MNLFVIVSDRTPLVFIKAATPEDAFQKFTTDMSEGEFADFERSPYRVVEVTMKVLMDLTPSEFIIIDQEGLAHD